MNGKSEIIESELWQRIRNFFDRNLEVLKGKKQETPDRRTQRKIGGSGEMRIVSPPYGKPVKGKPGTNVVYAPINTPEQAKRANRLNSILYK